MKLIKNTFFLNILIFLVFFVGVAGVVNVYASETDGTINTVNKFAKGLEDSVGFINFGTSQGNVHITDTAVTGYAWGENIGWVNLAPTSYGVTNNSGGGMLGGYAWGEMTGWINFAPTHGGVTIDSSGNFNGYAWSENYGWIIFNCATNSSCGAQDFRVSTDWRPVSVRTPPCNPPNTLIGGVCTPPPPPPPPPCNPPNTLVGGICTPPPPPSCDSPNILVNGICSPPPPPPCNPPNTLVGGICTPPPPPSCDSPNILVNGVCTSSFSPPGVGGGDAGGVGGGSSGGSGNSGGGMLITETVKNVTEAIKESASFVGETAKVIAVKTKETAKVVAVKTKEITESPVGSVVTKTVATVGAVTGGVAAASALFFSPLLFSEIILIPFRIWAALLAVLGIRKRYRPWGVVYDSVTKQPLDPAVVVIEDEEGNIIKDSITDLDGRFGFFVDIVGSYKIVANKTNYIFPSKNLFGKTEDELYSDLYFGEPISIGGLGSVITKNIPMDPEKFDWNEFAKREKHVMRFYSKRDVFFRKFSNVMFTVGLFVAIVAFLVVPVPYNMIIFFSYLFILGIRILGFKPKTFGLLREKETGAPLSFAIIHVFSAELKKEIMKRVSDKFGQYYCLLPKGEYYIVIDKKNTDQSYTTIFTSSVINAKNGIINSNFQI